MCLLCIVNVLFGISLNGVFDVNVVSVVLVSSIF